MTYRVTFQCPMNGTPMMAQFVAGRLSVVSLFDDRDRDLDGMPEDEKEEHRAANREANVWAAPLRIRFKTLAAATAALEKMGVDMAMEGGWSR